MPVTLIKRDQRKCLLVKFFKNTCFEEYLQSAASDNNGF